MLLRIVGMPKPDRWQSWKAKHSAADVRPKDIILA